MFKIILKDGTSFDVPSTRLYSTQLKIIDSKAKLITYEDKLTLDNLSCYTLEDGNGNYLAEFTDKKYILNSLHFEKYEGVDVGVYDLADVDKTEKKLNELTIATERNSSSIEESVKVLDITNVNLNETKLSLDNTIKDVEDIKKEISNKIDIESMTLEEYKQYYTQLSKSNLQTYLETHPITSTCHNINGEVFAITKEKQQQLAQVIILTMCSNICNFVSKNNALEDKDELTTQICQAFSLMVGNTTTQVSYTPSWNESGKSCTYDWTLSQLQQLAFEMDSVVRPLISKQQKLEEEINLCESKEDVSLIDISFTESV